MAARRRLDRKARSAVTVATALILAFPLFAIAKVVAGQVGQQSEQQIFHPQEDQLVQLRDGSTMLVKHSSPVRRIADWLKVGLKGQETFQVGNSNFVTGSANLSRDGWEHLGQFAQMLRGHPGVSATILFSPSHGNSTTLPLEHMRADRIHDEAVKQGVDEHQIAVAREGFEPGHDPAKDAGLDIVLTNRG
jgi:outer membrane protein OmpA-like peptidoglycan-associated protein